jgi:hypothetical protein
MMTTSCGWVDLDPDLLALRQAALDQVLIIQPEIQEPHTAVYPFQNEVRSLVDSFLAKNVGPLTWRVVLARLLAGPFPRRTENSLGRLIPCIG